MDSKPPAASPNPQAKNKHTKVRVYKFYGRLSKYEELRNHKIVCQVTID